MHTPEPWKVGEVKGPAGLDGMLSVWAERNGKTRAICDVRRGWFEYTDKGQVIERDSDIEGKANADRIVACVNALAGIADPAVFVRAARELAEGAEQIRRNREAYWHHNKIDPSEYPVSAGFAWEGAWDNVGHRLELFRAAEKGTT